MISVSPPIEVTAPPSTALPRLSSSKATALRPTCSAFPRRHKGLSLPLQRNYSVSVSKQHGLSRLTNGKFIASSAVNMAAGQSDGSGEFDPNRITSSLRMQWERLPQPVKCFPWTKVLTSSFELIFELFLMVTKYLCIPILAVSSLSEMSYCAHERKMVLIPAPFLAGIAVAGALKDTAVELSPSFKELEFPWHLLLIAAFFMLLKLPGPYYPYWGRLLIPHFANGGLWRTLWFAFSWLRRPQEVIKMNEISVAENQSAEKKI